DIVKEYQILLGELEKYNPELLDKKRVLAITKTDLADREIISETSRNLPQGINTVFISSVTGYNIDRLKDILWETLNEKE
ncbi:MAG TPA: GTPase ObgE, partial [Bacteroidales bacterium]|nr:GTPase ObgE [Bacteroidales bacterium]